MSGIDTSQEDALRSMQRSMADDEIERLGDRIVTVANTTGYGRVVIVVSNGRVVLVEKHISEKP